MSETLCHAASMPGLLAQDAVSLLHSFQEAMSGEVPDLRRDGSRPVGHELPCACASLAQTMPATDTTSPLLTIPHDTRLRGSVRLMSQKTV